MKYTPPSELVMGTGYKACVPQLLLLKLLLLPPWLLMMGMCCEAACCSWCCISLLLVLVALVAVDVVLLQALAAVKAVVGVVSWPGDLEVEAPTTAVAAAGSSPVMAATAAAAALGSAGGAGGAAPAVSAAADTDSSSLPCIVGFRFGDCSGMSNTIPSTWRCLSPLGRQPRFNQTQSSWLNPSRAQIFKVCRE